MAPFYVGDIPAEDLVIEPARGGEPIDLAPFEASDTEVVLRTFEGDIVPADFLVTFDQDVVVLEWPATSVLETPGLHTLTVTLINDAPAEEAQEQLAPVYLVVQEENGWHTLDSARAEWADAEPLSDLRLFQLLELARQQVVAYAPTLAEDASVPTNYRQGQLMQARNLLNAAQVDPSGAIGEDTFALRPYPLDWMVKQVLRPQRAVPGVG